MQSQLVSQIEAIIKRDSINNKERVWLYEILSQRAELGSVIDALPILIKRNKKRGRKSQKKAQILEKLYTVGRSGGSIADALKKMIPEDEFHLISSAETSGHLAEGLEKASTRLDQKVVHQKLINDVLFSIGQRLVMVICLLVFLGQSLFSSLERLTPIDEWNGLAVFMYQLSTTVHIWGTAILIVCLSIGLGVKYSLSHIPNSQLREFLMKYLQPWNIHRDLCAMTIIDSFNAMVGSRSEKQALMILQESSTSPWLKDCIRKMIKRINLGAGNPLLDNPLLPEQFNDVLASLGDDGDKSTFYKKSVERLNRNFNEKLVVLKNRIDLIGTIVLFASVGCMIISYMMISIASLKGV